MRYFHTITLLEQQLIEYTQRVTIAEASGDTEAAQQLRTVREDVVDAINALQSLAAPSSTDFKQRLYLERSDVSDRTKLLGVFLKSTAFESLQQKMQTLLTKQYEGMTTYLESVNERLELLEAQAPTPAATQS